MSRRSLAILSEGRLSDSQRKSLTLLSLGWLAVAIVPEPTNDGRVRRRTFMYAINNNFLDNSPSPRIKRNRDKIKKEDEEILAIIRTFISWEV